MGRTATRYFRLGLCLLVLAGLPSPLQSTISAQTPFLVTVKRTALSIDKKGAKVLTGRLIVNGTDIGPTFENPAYKIPAGLYRGTIRYVSGKNFVQGSLGQMAKTGDFLLSVESVAQGALMREHILFHGGDVAAASEGCIMLGAVPRDTNDEPRLGTDHPLYRLRQAFYGTAQPISSPDKAITVLIQAEP